MPQRKYARCRECGVHRDKVGLLSCTGLCGPCGRRLLHENIDGIHTHSGPAFDRWRRAMAASVGAFLLDDLELDT